MPFRRWFLLGALIAVSIHSALALLIFGAVWAAGHGQAGLSWIPLLAADFPSVWPTMELLNDTALRRYVVEWFNAQVYGLGANVWILLIVGIFGSAQWFLIGGVLAITIGFMRARIRLYRQPRL